MNREDIHKLIGGYATGSLTEEERRQLFEAALDDQELFDALQEEQVLKNLLDDPLSRERLHRAVAASLPQANASWFRRPWIWAASASVALAATLLVVLVEWNHPPVPMERAALQKPVSGPQAEVPRNVAVPQPKVKRSERELRRNPAKKERRSEAEVKALAVPQSSSQPFSQPPPPQPRAAIALPQAAENPAQLDEMKAPNRVMRSVGGLAGAVRDTSSTIYSIARKLENGAYFEVPTDAVFQPGETIRLTIFPRVSGPLSLEERDQADATWRRIFPLIDGDTVQVRALENYAVPVDIVVTRGARLRITVGSLTTIVALKTT